MPAATRPPPGRRASRRTAAATSTRRRAPRPARRSPRAATAPCWRSSGRRSRAPPRLQRRRRASAPPRSRPCPPARAWRRAPVAGAPPGSGPARRPPPLYRRSRPNENRFPFWLQPCRRSPAADRSDRGHLPAAGGLSLQRGAALVWLTRRMTDVLDIADRLFTGELDPAEHHPFSQFGDLAEISP